MYYLRSRPAVDAIKFTLDVEMLLKEAGQIEVHKSVNLFNVAKTPDKENGIEDSETSEKTKKIRGDTGKPVQAEAKPEEPEVDNDTCPMGCLSCGS